MTPPYYPPPIIFTSKINKDDTEGRCIGSYCRFSFCFNHLPAETLLYCLGCPPDGFSSLCALDVGMMNGTEAASSFLWQQAKPVWSARHQKSMTDAMMQKCSHALTWPMFSSKRNPSASDIWVKNHQSACIWHK